MTLCVQRVVRQMYVYYLVILTINKDIQTGTNYFIFVGSPTCVVSFVHCRQIPHSEGRCEPIIVYISNGTYVNSTRKVVFLLSRCQDWIP